MTTPTFAKSTPAVALSPQQVVQRIRNVVGRGGESVALHEPLFRGNEKKYLADCIDTGWVSYAGSYVTEFERALARTCGVEHAIAVSSGTVALQVALVIAGVKPGEEVLVPALTFVATANAIVHAGAIPHFIDADEVTLGISPAALSEYLEKIGERRKEGFFNRLTGRKISAILPVHVFGHPVDMDRVGAIAATCGLIVVEDATEALGSKYRGRFCGSLAPIATLSFNGNKVVTTGGGGAVLTSDDLLADRVRHLTTTAKVKHRWSFNHDEVGWNFRMPNVNAAIGLAQLERLPEVIAAKRRLWRKYADAFAGVPGLRVFSDAPFAESNYWLVTLLLDACDATMLDPILAATNDDGLMTRPLWTPMHRLPMYAENPRAPLPVTESLAARVFNIPSSPFLAAS